MAHLPLSKGYTALVDDQDFPNLSKSKWAYKEGYAVRSIKVGKKHKKQYLHHAVLPVPPGHQILFKNRNGLDCRRSNLRVVTILEARRAAGPRKNASSRFKGVSLQRGTGLFKAEIVANGRPHHLGVYADEKVAARAYDAAARQHFGPIGYLNFPNGSTAVNRSRTTEPHDKDLNQVLTGYQRHQNHRVVEE